MNACYLVFVRVVPVCVFVHLPSLGWQLTRVVTKIVVRMPIVIGTTGIELCMVGLWTEHKSQLIGIVLARLFLTKDWLFYLYYREVAYLTYMRYLLDCAP